MIVSGFNALGAPLPQTAATTLNSGTPTYGGFDPEPNPNPFNGLSITSLAIDQSNNLWVGDSFNKVIEINTIPSLSAQTPLNVAAIVTSLTIDGQGNAWFINQVG